MGYIHTAGVVAVGRVRRALADDDSLGHAGDSLVALDAGAADWDCVSHRLVLSRLILFRLVRHR